MSNTDNESLLPGFGATQPTDATTAAAEPQTTDGAVPPAADPRSVLSLKRESSAERPADAGKSADAAASGRRPYPRLVVSAALAVLGGIAFAAAFRLIPPRIVIRKVEVVKEVQIEPDGIPMALLPQTADADLWETVSNMSGEIDGVPLVFKRGISSADGPVYRVQLDFCRSGNSIYARVDGTKRLVVQLDGRGRILKTYPAPKNGKPLKEIFAR